MALTVHFNHAGRRLPPGGLGYFPVEWSWQALTGPEAARIEVAGPIGPLWDLLDWLATDLSILDSDHGEVWYGFIHEVEVRAGAAAYSASLDLLANRIIAVGGDERAYADHALSQATYGVHERIISVPDSAPYTTIEAAAALAVAQAAWPESVVKAAVAREEAEEATIATATAARKAVEAENKANPYLIRVLPEVPKRSEGKRASELERERTEGIGEIMRQYRAGLAGTLARAAPGLTGWGATGFGPGGGGVGATLHCKGHLHALDWRYYPASTETAVVDATILVGEIVEALCAYVPTVANAVPGGFSGTLWSREGDGTRRAFDYVRDLLSTGDGQRRLRLWPEAAGAYSDRRVATLALEPEADDGPAYLIDRAGRLTDRTGAPVSAFALTAGFWVGSLDLGRVGPSGPLSFVDKSRYEVAAGRYRFEPRGYALARGGISLAGG